MRLPTALTCILAGALFIAAAAPAEAARRSKTRFDGIRDCERTANIQFRRQNPAFRSFMIDRAHVTGERYADRVGSVFVSTIYHGRATYDAGGIARSLRFICLYGGFNRRAVFVYTLPD